MKMSLSENPYHNYTRVFGSQNYPLFVFDDSVNDLMGLGIRSPRRVN